MKPLIMFENLDGSPYEVVEIPIRWFIALNVGDWLMTWRPTERLGWRLWSAAWERTSTVWEEAK